MARATNSLLTFNGGVWSPRLRGRVDMQGATAALRTCQNFVVRRSGALRRRPGFALVAEITAPAGGSGSTPPTSADILLYQSQIILEPVAALEEQPFL